MILEDFRMMFKKVLSIIMVSVSVYLFMVTDFMFRMYHEINTVPCTRWFILLGITISLSIISIVLIISYKKDQETM